MLAQTSDSGSIFIISFILIALLIVGFVVLGVIRRRFRDDEQDTGPGGSTGFALSDLRQLHRDGKITTEEFERAKHAIVEAARNRAAAQAEEGKVKGFPVMPKPYHHQPPDHPPPGQQE